MASGQSVHFSTFAGDLKGTWHLLLRRMQRGLLKSTFIELDSWEQFVEDELRLVVPGWLPTCENPLVSLRNAR